MNCNRVVSENLIERYLDGKLDDQTRDALELHFFACESCLSMLQTVQAVRPVLAEMPAPAAAAQRARPSTWLWLAVAAGISLAVVFWPRDTPPPTPITAQTPAEPPKLTAIRLSEIQPAPYFPTLFRDGAAPPGPAWEQAMRLYQEHQWAAAAAALTKLPDQPPRPAAAHFAGISFLLAGQTGPALTAFDRVIALGPQSPLEEEARYYRAQALLLAGRLAEARPELQRVIEGHGDYEAQARSLLNKL